MGDEVGLHWVMPRLGIWQCFVKGLWVAVYPPKLKSPLKAIIPGHSYGNELSAPGGNLILDLVTEDRHDGLVDLGQLIRARPWRVRVMPISSALKPG